MSTPDRLTDEEREALANAADERGWAMQSDRVSDEVLAHADATFWAAAERILAARLAAQPPACFGKVWDVDCGEMAARVERVRRFVDHPGNWSAGEARRRVILDLLDGKDVPGLVEVDGGLIQP